MSTVGTEEISEVADYIDHWHQCLTNAIFED